MAARKNLNKKQPWQAKFTGSGTPQGGRIAFRLTLISPNPEHDGRPLDAYMSEEDFRQFMRDTAHAVEHHKQQLDQALRGLQELGFAITEDMLDGGAPSAGPDPN